MLLASSPKFSQPCQRAANTVDDASLAKTVETGWRMQLFEHR
jgi:hypothetical protein